MSSSADAGQLIALEDELTNLKVTSTNGMTRDEALKLALQCAELQIKFLELAGDKGETKRMNSQCNRILQLAEQIKTDASWQPSQDLLASIQPLKPASLTPSSSTGQLYPSLDGAWASKADSESQVSLSKTLFAPVPSRKLPSGEKTLLLKASSLNNTQFPPWENDPDDQEFLLPESQVGFLDDFEYRLSKEQKEILEDWKHPSEALPPPSWRKNLQGLQGPPDHVKQTRKSDYVQDAATDCSVVASMCAGAARAERGHARILSNILYPHDSKSGKPTLSPNGKYIVRLHFNGCFRKVVIDDRLPVSKNSRMLHVVDRNNPEYIWPALVEKAYLKMRGGYDFPGSNSGTDLWVITGWIPEQLFLDMEETDVTQLWSRVFKAFKYGDVLVTLGTGKMSTNTEQALGLASQHDYAVIDFKESDHQRFLLIKNPWFEGGMWNDGVDKGAPATSRSGSNDLLDSPNLPTEDNHPIWQTGSLQTTKHGTLTPGTFWMDLDDAMQHFEYMYLNWNPGLFQLRQDFHFNWDMNTDSSVGRSPPGSFHNNPQYSVSSKQGGIAWFILSRHFTNSSKLSLSDSETGHIGLYAFASDGRRVILSKGSLQQSSYVDSPQILLKMDLKATMSYTIVVSEQNLHPTLHTMTLSAFSLTPLVMERAASRYHKKISQKSEWSSATAGGNASCPTYSQNPQFALRLPAPSAVALLLETLNPDLSVHVKLIHGQGERVYSVQTRDVVVDSSDYRRGCALAELVVPLDAGTYTVICSTFEQGQLGSFRLHVESDVEAKLTAIPREGAGRIRTGLADASFSNGVRILAAPIHPTRLAKVNIKARYIQSAVTHSPIRITIELGRGPDRRILIASADGSFSDSANGVRTEDLDLQPNMAARHGMWLVLERMGGFSGEGRSEERIGVELFTDAVNVLEVGVWRAYER